MREFCRVIPKTELPLNFNGTSKQQSQKEPAGVPPSGVHVHSFGHGSENLRVMPLKDTSMVDQIRMRL